MFVIGDQRFRGGYLIHTRESQHAAREKVLPEWHSGTTLGRVPHLVLTTTRTVYRQTKKASQLSITTLWIFEYTLTHKVRVDSILSLDGCIVGVHNDTRGWVTVEKQVNITICAAETVKGGVQLANSHKDLVRRVHEGVQN